MRLTTTLVITSLAAALVACSSDDTHESIDAADAPVDAGPDTPDAPDGLTTVAIIPAAENRDLDVLFVVDNSGSMAEEQVALAQSFPSLINALAAFPEGLPNLHLGIVSTNVGSGGVNIGGCSTAARPQGDDGNLLTNGCAGIAGAFISDIRAPDGSRITNYTGDMGTLFTCMAQLGTAGCGFEQPLEAMFRALQAGKNPGFLRATAKLAIIILTDEDDCSIGNPQFFGDPTGTITSPLGPRTSFRCHEFGVQCDNDPNPRAFGTRTGCVPRENSMYAKAVAPYVEYLRSLKLDPRDVVVAGITGNVDDARTVSVQPDIDDATRPAVQPSCTSSSGVAFPGFRLKTFFDAFPGRSAIATICNENLVDAYGAIGEQIRNTLGDPCVDVALADVEPAIPGLQFRCEVRQYLLSGGVPTNVVDLPACSAGAPPCWRFTADPVSCPLAPDNRAIVIDRDQVVPPGTEVEVRCAVE